MQLNKLTTPCERDFLSYQPQSTSSCVSLGRFPPSPTMCPLPSPSFSSPSLAIHRLISLRDRASHPSSFLYVIPFTFSRSHFFHQGEKNPPAYRPPPTLALDLNSNPLISRIHSSPFFYIIAELRSLTRIRSLLISIWISETRIRSRKLITMTTMIK